MMSIFVVAGRVVRRRCLMVMLRSWCFFGAFFIKGIHPRPSSLIEPLSTLRYSLLRHFFFVQQKDVRQPGRLAG